MLNVERGWDSSARLLGQYLDQLPMIYHLASATFHLNVQVTMVTVIKKKTIADPRFHDCLLLFRLKAKHLVMVCRLIVCGSSDRFLRAGSRW